MQTEDHLNARNLYGACLDLLQEVDAVAKAKKLSADTSDVETRANLNSAGDIEFWSHVPTVICLLSVIVLAINGGGLEIKDWDLKLSTPGLLKAISDFLNDQSRRRTTDELRKKLEKLNIKDSEQFRNFSKRYKRRTNDQSLLRASHSY